MNYSRIKKQFAIPLLMSFIVLMLLSCTKEKGKLTPVSPLPGCDTTSALTYTNYVSKVVTTNCNFSGCHDPGSPSGDYSNYVELKDKVTSGVFSDRVFVKKDMPSNKTPGPLALSACDLKKLKIWVDYGAPQ